MALRYRIHRELKVVHTVLGEVEETAELRVYSSQLRHDPEFEGDFDHVIEFADGSVEADGSGAVQILSVLVPPVTHVRIAIVAAGDLEFAISRKFQSVYQLTEDVFLVCRSVDEAFTWLDKDAASPDWSDWRDVSADTPASEAEKETREEV